MDAELKQKWVAALRSGKYQQGTGRLRTRDDKYCCLGVLREIMLPGSNLSDDEFDVLPKDLALKAGLEPRMGSKWNDNIGNQYPLATMNDDGKTFAEIADYIEANL